MIAALGLVYCTFRSKPSSDKVSTYGLPKCWALSDLVVTASMIEPGLLNSFVSFYYIRDWFFILSFGFLAKGSLVSNLGSSSKPMISALGWESSFVIRFIVIGAEDYFNWSAMDSSARLRPNVSAF